MELKNLNDIEAATQITRGELFRLGITLFFIVAIMIFTSIRITDGNTNILIVVAAIIGGYMAMNIGANDVANNVGPAVGSRALNLTMAVVIAAVFEASGALIAGGDVVNTIKQGIIHPDLIEDSDTFIWLMMSGLLAGAIWLNIATALGAPVSTTHTIVGGVLGAGMAAGGAEIANWDKVFAITAGWVFTPVVGGLIAAGFLYFIKRYITYQTDMIGAAKMIVPILVASMAWAFCTYLLLKGLNKLYAINFITAASIGAIFATGLYLIIKPIIANMSRNLPNQKSSVNSLFTVPLILAAALLSFAHGANDVANAVGPLAAIHETIKSGNIAQQAHVPIWIMVVGATGICLGLILYGPRIIRTVGIEITELDKMRAFCIAMAAALTVIIASQLGLPVSSTHIAVGAVFGVGFLREYLKRSYGGRIEEIKYHFAENKQEEIEAFLIEFEQASIIHKQEMLTQLKQKTLKPGLKKKQIKSLRAVYKQELVRRSQLLKIVAAWVITVPMTGLMGAILFYLMTGLVLNQ